MHLQHLLVWLLGVVLLTNLALADQLPPGGKPPRRLPPGYKPPGHKPPGHKPPPLEDDTRFVENLQGYPQKPPIHNPPIVYPPGGRKPPPKMKPSSLNDEPIVAKEETDSYGKPPHKGPKPPAKKKPPPHKPPSTN